MRRIACTTVLMALLLGGCGTHHAMVPPKAAFARAGFLDATKAAQIEQALTDGDIATMLNADVRAKLPTSIAVARLDPTCGYTELQTVDAEELEGWEKVAGEQPLITGIQPLSSLAVSQPTWTADRGYRSGMTLHTLRTAAAKQQCELLLVYVQADSEVENLKDAAILYWTIIGLLVVPGKRSPEESLKYLQEASRRLMSQVVGAAQASR